MAEILCQLRAMGSLLVLYPIIPNPFSGDHRKFSHSAGFQTMEHTLPMPSLTIVEVENDPSWRYTP